MPTYLPDDVNQEVNLTEYIEFGTDVLFFTQVFNKSIQQGSLICNYIHNKWISITVYSSLSVY
jgi:hypothetical protein